VDHALARAGEDFGFLRRAGLILAAGPDRLSHALVPRGPGISARDYFPLEDGLNRNPVPGGSELVLRYSDLNVAGTLGVTITQRVSLAEAPPGDDFAIIEYDIVPLDQPVEDLRFGLALDWSMPSAALAGPVGYVAERLIEITDGLGVEAVEPQVGAAVAGARILGSPAAVGRAGLGQWQTDEPGWNLAGDPSASPTDADLWSLMQPGRDDSLDRTGDRVGILSSAVGRIDPGESRRVAVAFAIANDRAALEATLDRARVTWETGRVGLTPESMSTGFISFSSNPFRSSTEASYVLTESGPVRIDVFDLRGRRVRTLVDGVREVGVHRADWDGRDQRGVPVASGVYLVRLQAGGTDTSQAITRVR
jgi:hypothetical protein